MREVWGVDVYTQPIPVRPAVHFFMGGLAVHLNHETNLHNLFAIGECASMYHGANRLGGNSLLAAIYSGNVAADEIAGRTAPAVRPDFSGTLAKEHELLRRKRDTRSAFPVMYIRDMLAETMQKNLGIVRDEVRPLQKFPVIHDLVVDRSSIHENLTRTNLYIGTYRQSVDEDHGHQYNVAKCLKCGLCLEVCPAGIETIASMAKLNRRKNL
ncbi:MAG: FAD-binding protein [Eubacterium sp.]|nr:FAD-binding protein [Eubacterium sp.]